MLVAWGIVEAVEAGPRGTLEGLWDLTQITPLWRLAAIPRELAQTRDDQSWLSSRILC